LNAGVQGEKVRQVINLVTPFCWVDPDAAGRLNRLSIGRTGTAAVAWRREWDLCERMYLRRAFCSRRVSVVPVGDARSWGGDLGRGVDHIRKCLLKRLRSTGPQDDDAVRRQVKRKRDEGWQIFLLIPADSVDNGLLKEVGARWPGVQCFLHDPTLSPARFRRFGLDDVPYLEPELTAEAESDARSDWSDLMELAGVSDQLIENGEAFL
jgi:hypothetical protein